MPFTLLKIFSQKDKSWLHSDCRVSVSPSLFPWFCQNGIGLCHVGIAQDENAMQAASHGMQNCAKYLTDSYRATCQ